VVGYRDTYVEVELDVSRLDYGEEVDELVTVSVAVVRRC
jgi:hypothetical protein